MNEEQTAEILQLAGELNQFKQGKLYARLREMQVARYTTALTELTRAASESSDLKVRGLALDVQKSLAVWDELEAIEKKGREVAAEANPPPEGEKSEFDYDTP
jgi:hypothetical protein